MALSWENILEFAKARKIGRIGHFRPEKFEKYLRTISARPEYRMIKYRSPEAFEKAGDSLPSCKSIIVMAVDYFHDSDYNGDSLKLSNYSRYCWNTVGRNAAELKEYLLSNGHSVIPVDIPHRAAALLAGLGSVGRNCNFYADGLGSYVGIMCIGSDIEFEDSSAGCEEKPMDSCSACKRCIKACPVGAIDPEGFRINPLRCISFLNRHPEEPNVIFPEDPKALDNWIAGCEICQDVCPVNRKIKHDNAVVENDILELYGMKIPNKASVDKALVKEAMPDITVPEYRTYLKKVLQDD